MLYSLVVKGSPDGNGRMSLEQIASEEEICMANGCHHLGLSVVYSTMVYNLMTADAKESFPY
jgi:hypothetical protein